MGGLPGCDVIFQQMAASHAADACSDVMRFWIEAGGIVR